MATVVEDTRLETGEALTPTTVPKTAPRAKTRTLAATTTPRKILRSKTREKLPTATGTRDVKKDKEKITQSSWKLTYGEADLNELLLFEGSTKFIIYEKEISKAITPFSKNSSRDLETKRISERQKQQLLKVVLCRTDIIGIKNLESLASYSGRSLSPLFVPTGKRPLTVFMLFGDGHRIDVVPEDYIKGYVTWKAFDNSLLILSQIMNMPLGHYTNHFSFPPWDVRSDESRKSAQKMAKSLKELHSLDTDTFLGITTGDISQSLCKNLFDILNKQGLIDPKDYTFLQEIAPFRTLTQEQTTLSMQIEYMVMKSVPDYGKAIELTRKMHELSRAEAYKRGTSSVYDKNTDNMIEIDLIDDCTGAFKLGKHLEKRSLLADAVEAYKILTDKVNVVKRIGNVRINYHSFYAVRAKSKIENFAKTSITSSLTIDSEGEKLREKVIKENLTSLVKGGDVNIDLFLNSLEIECGLPSESDLFIDVDKKGRQEEILSKVLLNMATKICQQQSELLSLKSENKERAEIDCSKFGQVAQTQPVQKASGELLRKSLKVKTSGPLLGTLEEENDENFPPSPTSPPSLHFAYSPRSLVASSSDLSKPSILKKSKSAPYNRISS